MKHRKVFTQIVQKRHLIFFKHLHRMEENRLNKQIVISETESQEYSRLPRSQNTWKKQQKKNNKREASNSIIINKKRQ